MRNLKSRIAAVSTVALLAAQALLPPVPSKEAAARPLTASEFGRLIQRISEEGGHFWNDNYVSNEESYLHPLGKIQELGIRGGVYIGVGPSQNFTYIAKIRPSYAFILDIRRQNLLQHLMFKALFHFSRDRRDYLSLLLSRPRGPDLPDGREPTVGELERHFRGREPDARLFRRTQARIRNFLTEACRVELTDRDFLTIHKIHRAFFLRGLAIKYDYIPVPSYGEFLLETDLRGQRQNFLNSAAEFRFLQHMHWENRIIPVTGDFAGNRALREIGECLRERGEKLTVFYTSNVEQYLVRSLTWQAFLDNLRELPRDDNAVFIRAFWSNQITHPEVVKGYRFTQTLQWLQPFLADSGPGKYETYWDIVTAHTIPLR